VPALQQASDLFEGRRARELMDVITAVEQQTSQAIDITDRSGGCDDIRKASGRLVRHFVFLPHDPSAVYL